MSLNQIGLIGLVVLLLSACDNTAKAPPAAAVPAVTSQAIAAPAQATPLGGQRGGGKPYELVDSEVWDVPDPATVRTYQVFVALPRGYADNPQRRYPVLYATDGDYAFPLVKQIARRLNGEGPAIEDFILVGLSYAVGDEPMPSRRRDYTPTPEDGPGAAPVATHGKSADYIRYLRDRVLPFVASRYRTDEQRRLYLGHSYGGLLGTQILLSTPDMFAGYILGSPSYWYGEHAMVAQEKPLPPRIQTCQRSSIYTLASTSKCATTRITTWSSTHRKWRRHCARGTIRRCISRWTFSMTRTT